jgi:F-type H+-transporting ATPase subunit b
MVWEAEFWVALAFLVFLAVLAKVGVHRLIFKALDTRSAKIRAELDEARQLREEAQQLVAEYKRRRDEAESEAQGIVAAAQSEAERLAAEAKTKAEDFVARRTKMAQTKIAQAEAQAVSDVRAAAADAAAKAAAAILARETTGPAADTLVDAAIRDVRAKLH